MAWWTYDGFPTPRTGNGISPEHIEFRRHHQASPVPREVPDAALWLPLRIAVIPQVAHEKKQILMGKIAPGTIQLLVGIIVGPTHGGQRSLKFSSPGHLRISSNIQWCRRGFAGFLDLGKISGWRYCLLLWAVSKTEPFSESHRLPLPCELYPGMVFDKGVRKCQIGLICLFPIEFVNLVQILSHAFPSQVPRTLGISSARPFCDLPV